MENEQTHDAEIIEIFHQISAEIPRSGGLRAVSEKGFIVAVNAMMNKAYYYGELNGFKEAEAVLNTVLSK